jgi:hypothetical protein
MPLVESKVKLKIQQNSIFFKNLQERLSLQLTIFIIYKYFRSDTNYGY